MKLKQDTLGNKTFWADRSIILPQYDRQMMSEHTMKEPRWIHMGAGNLFRGFLAVSGQRLLNQGLSQSGIIVCEGYDEEIIDKVYKPFDDLNMLVVLKGDGTTEQEVIGSVAQSLKGDMQYKEDWNELVSYFEMPTLQMITLTITEKGYTPFLDQEENLETPKTLMAKLASLCYKRYLAGAYPLALVSMDNCSHNGEKLYNGIMAYIYKWYEAGEVEKGFVEYMQDTNRVSFPWTMIDKITPRPDEMIQTKLEQEGLEEMEGIITSKGTYLAPFVNTEEAEYLVVEDSFPNGRPCLEKAGILFTTRETVNKAEKMKVCTCLNPLHTALAIYGCLLNVDTIHQAMQDEVLRQLVYKLGYEEGLPVVVNPEVITPSEFIKEVLEKRLTNPFMPDTPWRIATDTSQKLAIRFGETLKAYQTREDLKAEELEIIPLVLAGWCRYLMGINDQGEIMEISSDPLLDELKGMMQGFKLGEKPDQVVLQKLLARQDIFGIDLYEIGIGKKIEEYFQYLSKDIGAVRQTLERILVENV